MRGRNIRSSLRSGRLRAKERFYNWIGRILSAFFSCFPIQKKKVVGNAFSGMSYSDNAKYIMEELRGHGLDPFPPLPAAHSQAPRTALH